MSKLMSCDVHVLFFKSHPMFFVFVFFIFLTTFSKHLGTQEANC